MTAIPRTRPQPARGANGQDSESVPGMPTRPGPAGFRNSPGRPAPASRPRPVRPPPVSRVGSSGSRPTEASSGRSGGPRRTRSGLPRPYHGLCLHGLYECDGCWRCSPSAPGTGPVRCSEPNRFPGGRGSPRRWVRPHPARIHRSSPESSCAGSGNCPPGARRASSRQGPDCPDRCQLPRRPIVPGGADPDHISASGPTPCQFFERLAGPLGRRLAPVSPCCPSEQSRPEAGHLGIERANRSIGPGDQTPCEPIVDDWIGRFDPRIPRSDRSRSVPTPPPSPTSPSTGAIPPA